MMKAGFVPDSISTDLHTASSQSGMKDMLDVMSKFLMMGMSVDDVILRSTWNPAKEIKLEQLGNLSVGSPADVAVLRVEKGSFGFVDQVGLKIDGTQKFGCEITLRDGATLFDANGRTRAPFDPSAPLPPVGGRQGAPAAAPAPARGSAPQ